MDAIHFAFLWTSSSLQFFEKNIQFSGSLDNIQFFLTASSFQSIGKHRVFSFWKTSIFGFFGKHQVFSFWNSTIFSGFFLENIEFSVLDNIELISVFGSNQFTVFLDNISSFQGFFCIVSALHFLDNNQFSSFF